MLIEIFSINLKRAKEKQKSSFNIIFLEKRYEKKIKYIFF